ncbi:class I SAM-dependent methyltransferase [Candidatus Kapaibacterium sp.]
MSVEFWDERFAANEYIYGKSPNSYFKSKLDKLNPGKILLPAEGEGRNAVYAAINGWDVYCFDQSISAMEKAEILASENMVNINYLIADADEVYYKHDFDVVVFIFSHFPNHDTLRKISNFTKENGQVIFECFSKKQIKYQLEFNSGGPNNIDLLFSLNDVGKIFRDFEILELSEVEVNLNEGNYHNGPASVIRFNGVKK